jgi:hypothetical protein
MTLDLTGGAADTVTGVTYNGAAMTLAGNVLVNSGNRIRYWILSAPTAGTHNVVITAPGHGTIYADAITYSGCAQSGQPVATNTGQTTNTSITVAVDAGQANCWVTALARNNTGTMSASTGLALNSDIIYDSNGTVATGSQNYKINDTVNNALGLIVAAIAPFVAGGLLVPAGFDGGMMDLRGGMRG